MKMIYAYQKNININVLRNNEQDKIGKKIDMKYFYEIST